MSESKHTPGPWIVMAGGSYKVRSPGARRIIAEADHMGGRSVSNDEAQANARLIAAAPELLDACGRARNYLACSGDGHSLAAEILDAAIAKATA